ncbi:MAG TPA: PAS domain S-box protein, partial [Anaerolineae bacterium]|nr:PAS domain S-box protein [Anaerolineae bacterium]
LSAISERDEDGKIIRSLAVLVDITERKRAEEALRESEEQLRLITDALPVLITYFDADQHYRFNNATYEQWFGLSLEAIKGRLVREILGEAVYEVVHPYLEAALAGQQVAFEQEIAYKTKTRYVEATYIPRFGHDGQVLGVYAIVTDISERKRAEEALRESQTFLEKAQEVAHIGSWKSEINGPRSLTWSKEVYRIFGLAEDQFDGTVNTFLAYVHPDDVEAVKAANKVALANNVPYNIEHRIVRPDGSIRWVNEQADVVHDESGAPVRLIGIVQDITERKKAEESLRESEARYRSLFMEMLDGFALHEIICDEEGQPCDYRFLEINPAFERLTGLRGADLIGRTVLEALPGTESYWIETYGQVALTGEPAHFENYSQALDNYYEVRAFSPQPGQFAVIFANITARRRAEEALRQSEERYRAVVENQTELVCRFLPDTTRTFVNEAYCSFFGKTREELIGHSFLPLIPEPEREATQKYIQSLVENPRVAQNEHRAILPNGEICWQQWVDRPIVDSQGRVIE